MKYENKEKAVRRIKKTGGRVLRISKRRVIKEAVTALASFVVVFCAVMAIGLSENHFGGALLFVLLGAVAVVVGLDAGVWDD